VVLAGLALTGHFTLWPSPDTPSYLAAAQAADPLGQPRIALYGWLIGGLIGGRGAWLLPWLQAAFYLAGLALLLRALRRLGLSAAGRMAIGLALGGANMLLLWANAALPELAGHAALLIALAAAIDIAGGRAMAWRLALVAAAMALAWAFRPAFLPFVLLLPLLPILLPHPVSRRRVAGGVLGLFAACLLPFLAFSGLRSAREGDFNVVSFGGFQMSGMAALMLTPGIADRLPADMQGAARQIIVGRQALVASGAALAIPRNSAGQRRFASAAAGYFDILVRTHDAVLYGAVAKLRSAGESWVAFNARMQRLALAVIRAAPVDYAAWLAGATARLVGHALVLDAAFLLGSAALAVALAMRASRPRRVGPGLARDVAILGVLTGLYTLGDSVLIVAATIPAERYIDSAMLFLPAWPIYAAIRLCQPGAPEAG
jgi:hypothetical protein